MSGKKEHKKGGKQYQQERKWKASEEGSVGSQKSRRSMGEKEEKEFEKADNRPAPVTESNNGENNSDEFPDIKLSFSGPPPSSHWKYIWKALNNNNLGKW